MSGHSIDGASTATIVTTNPDVDCSSDALNEFLDDVFAEAELDLESVDAARAVRELRDNIIE